MAIVYHCLSAWEVEKKSVRGNFRARTSLKEYKTRNSVKFVHELEAHPPLPHPLLPSYVTHAKLWIIMFFTAFLLFLL